jgi:cytoskeleton protein RodZ
MAGVEARFGEELRTERERRGIPLERLCAETKVNSRQLQALERGDYQSLPGGVFRRGIVRAYLHAVGLDEAEWMERFQTSYDSYLHATGQASESDEAAWATFALTVKKNRKRLDSRTGLRWFGVALLFVLLAAGAWAVFHGIFRWV